MPVIRRGTATWKTDVATPPILASMRKQPKKEKAGKATNLGEFNHSCWGKETCRRAIGRSRPGGAFPPLIWKLYL